MDEDGGVGEVSGGCGCGCEFGCGQGGGWEFGGVRGVMYRSLVYHGSLASQRA